jgi:hypothetical protein
MTTTMMMMMIIMTPPPPPPTTTTTMTTVCDGFTVAKIKTHRVLPDTPSLRNEESSVQLFFFCPDDGGNRFL